jgi:hypothetical protein
MADRSRSNLTEAEKLRVTLLSYSWKHEFSGLKGGPFSVILGLDFLRRTGLPVEMSCREFHFGLAPSKRTKFSL